MLLKAGLISLVLLVASRLLGLVRESAQAAAFGVSAAGDVAVLMLTLPDWLASLVAGGALAYVLLPHWARQEGAAQAATQRRVAGVLLVGGTVLALLMGLLSAQVVAVLVPGLPLDFVATARRGLWWSAAAIPAALLAALWVTRLQHERDFVGMYAANLVVNGVLVLCLWWLARQGVGANLALAVGGALVVAMVLRLVWLRWRLRPTRRAVSSPLGAVSAGEPDSVPATAPAAMPSATFWLWAALSSGLPLALPFAARSLASALGEGALATFNYAWKLVELPLVLAIQLTASLAFPVITRAFASGADPGPAVRRAFALGWTLACAAVAALWVGAPAIASLLFGWGRMDAQGLAQIALWAQAGAWSLLPQAVIAVALTVLATQGRLGAVAIAYAVGLGALLLAGTHGAADGLRLMLLLNAVLAAVAVATLVLLGRAARAWLPWRLMGLTSAALALVALASVGGSALILGLNVPLALGLSMLVAILIIATGWLGDAEMRAALRR